MRSWDSMEFARRLTMSRVHGEASCKCFTTLFVITIVMALSSAAAANGILHATRAVCGRTRYSSLCLESLSDSVGTAATGKDLVHASVNVTLQRFGQALYAASEITGDFEMDQHVRAAYDDCLELLDHSVELLSRSLTAITRGSGGSGSSDVLTWLSAAMTNHDTCTEGFANLNGQVKSQMYLRLKDLSELVSNCLAIYTATSIDRNSEDYFSGIPIEHRRRRRLLNLAGDRDPLSYPHWLSRRDRVLLQIPPTAITPDIIVSPDGNGTCKTITEAIKLAPSYSNRRFIIYIKAGKYEEDLLKISRSKTKIMLIGDGKTKTFISAGKSIMDNVTTFRTATFAASGNEFVARDLTFENWAGPWRHQAVALRISADHAVLYRCNIIGYQDTLYTHSQRQFYRDCDIYGTVDFIFGNAAVVFQNCSIIARKPLPSQKNTVTAQNRKDPNQNTGISIHACRIIAQSDLEAAKTSYPTYLGRPWKLYSRTVYMMSYMGDHIHPRGWLEWNSTFALDTLYYGEYMNYGPAAAISQRVNWKGYHVINSSVEATRFTVAQFIYGSTWLPSTGISFWPAYPLSFSFRCI